MTTKKSKPASLTSSLLARKGEAEPAAAPYSIPESGRQRPSESMAGKGNGNGGDLGHALSGMSRLPAGEPEPKPAAPESGMQPVAARPIETPVVREVPVARIVPPPQPPAASAGADPAAVSGEEIQSDAAPVAAAVGASGAKAAVEASAPSGERAATAQKPTPSSVGASNRDGGGGAGSDGESEQESARDARLLRFVYVMAALTGIVAIVLYAGGWLREGPSQRAAEETVASAPAPDQGAPATEAPTAVPSPAAEAGPSSAPQPPAETQAIPPAPPVTAEANPSTPETPVTTGGPPKLQPDGLPSMPSGAASGSPLPAPVGEPTIPVPSGPQSAAAEPKGPSDTQAGAGGKSDGAAAGSADAGAASPKVTVPDEAAAGKPVRDVPNLRVLAPALVKPEPAEGATPPAAPEPSHAPTLSVPKEHQTAAVPKAAPVTPPKAAASGGGYLVQLASVTSEKLAEREWARLQKAFPDVFGGRTLTIEKKEIAGRGTFYRVQSGGFATLDEARSVCNGLKEKKQACLPVNR